MAGPRLLRFVCHVMLAGCLAALASRVRPSAVQPLAAQAPAAIVTARNPLDLARPSESIVLSLADVQRVLTGADLRKVHVFDVVTKGEVLAQPIDGDDDGRFEELLFQADFAPGETRQFRLEVGRNHTYTASQFRAYGRFVRERRDDFAWENDRVAYRMYGQALESFERDKLTSSAVDVWVKRVRRLVINDWYMTDDYHRDHGEGADFYPSGTTRGCGGSGVWTGGRLYPSANFRNSRVLANGPLRVMFELTYAAWDVAGKPVSEVKRITLDAGQHLNRFEDAYTGRELPAEQASGIRRAPDARVRREPGPGLLRTWEALTGDGAGALGCAVLADPAGTITFAASGNDELVIQAMGGSGRASYYAGAAWDRGGDVAGVAAWDAYLDAFAMRVRAPIELSLTPAR